MQEERLIDTKDGGKLKEEGSIFWYFLWEEIFRCGKEVEAGRSTEWKAGKKNLVVWKLFLLKLEKEPT